MIIFEQAAKELLARRKAGMRAPRLEQALRPTSIEDALTIHSEMAKLATPKAWKCLLPPDENKVIAAPIFNLQQHCDEVRLFECDHVAMVEPEIAFVLARDLPAKNDGYSDLDIVNAVGSAHMALELMQYRFADDAGQSFYESLADCMVNQGVFIGPEIDKDSAINANVLDITIEQNAKRMDLAGKHPNPRAIDGFLWLVNFMCKRGVSFNAGDAFITGSFKGIVKLAFDQYTTIGYSGLGEYSVTFRRA